MLKKISVSSKFIIALAVVALVNILVALFVALNINTSLDEKIVDVTETQRPADISITLIKDSSCQECFSVDSISAGITKYNLNILSQDSLEYTSQAAQSIIDKYGIKKVPTFVVEGELSKDADFFKVLGQLGTINGDSFVADRLNPPYISLESGQLVGQIELVMLSDSNCQECYDVARHEQVLAGFGAYLTNTTTVDIASAQGRNLLSKYNIELVPTIILTGETDVYNNLKSVWSSVGSQETDGALVFRQGVKSMGVYKDLNANEIIDPKAQNNK